MNDPDLTVIEKLYHSGAWLCLGIVAAFFALRFASTRVAWLEQDHRAVYVSAILGGLATLIVPASQGTTPSVGMLVSAVMTVVALFAQPKPSLVKVVAPADAKPPSQAGSVRLGLLIAIAIAGIACGASAAQKRETTIKTTLAALDGATAAFEAYQGQHQLDIVSQATSHEDGVAKLAEFRKKRDEAERYIIAAYRTLAAAATVDDDPSLASALAAVLTLRTTLETIGVRLP